MDEVIALDRAALRGGNPFRVVPEFFSLLHRLRVGKFSLVVDFQGYGETAWLTRLTGARERWGTVYGRGREWAYTRGLKRNEDLHPADWNLLLLRECGLKIIEIKNQFCLSDDALAAAKKIFAEHKLDFTKPTLFLQPFTSSPHKNWPLENYLAVARHWRARGVQIVFGGGPGNLALLESARAENFPVIAGVPLLVTGGLMQLSTLVLGGDTGMLHLAIAQGKRALMLVHNLSPGRPILFRTANGSWPRRNRTSSTASRLKQSSLKPARSLTDEFVMFLVELQPEGFFQPQHPPVFFFARGQLMIRVGRKNSLRFRQPVLHDFGMRAGK